MCVRVRVRVRVSDVAACSTTTMRKRRRSRAREQHTHTHTHPAVLSIFARVPPCNIYARTHKEKHALHKRARQSQAAAAVAAFRSAAGVAAEAFALTHDKREFNPISDGGTEGG